MSIVIRPLAPEEFHRIAEIDVAEDGDLFYQYAGGKLTTVSETWRRPSRSAAEWARDLSTWQQQLQWDLMLGGFVGSSLAGMASIRYRLTADTAQLATLYVDREHRRQGLASGLAAEIIRLAAESGARQLYVSAIPSQSAVEFYLSHGFTPTDRPDPDLFALEPDDIHMIRVL